MSDLEPKYGLYNSLEQLLSAESLSNLLSQPVTCVEILPMNGHSGLAGGILSFVETNACRLVLKQMSMTTDFIMYSTHDAQCRAVKLWQYGLLDQLRPHLEHKIIAAAHDGDGWAILMEDLSGKVFEWGQPFPRELLPTFLDVLARIHATFWDVPGLDDPRLGLVGADILLQLLPWAQNYSGPPLGVIQDWLLQGWEVVERLLQPQVFRQMLDLIENPQPLLDALKRYPVTLLHGDYRKENLAYHGQPVVLDWQGASRSLMIIDLAWMTKHRDIQQVMSQEEAFHYYRRRLERYLDRHFDDREWQAMVALGCAVDALRWIPFAGFIYKTSENADDRAFMENSARQHGRMVMDDVHWR